MALRGSGLRFFKDISEKAMIRREARKLNLTEAEVAKQRMLIAQSAERAASRQFQIEQRKFFSNLRRDAVMKARQCVSERFQKSEKKVFNVPEAIVRKDSLLGKLISWKR